MIPSELWWNYVPAGVSVRDSIGQRIINGGCVFLNASRLPWKEELLNCVQAEVVLNDAEMNWNVIDAEGSIGSRPIDYLGSYFGVAQIPVEQMIKQKIRQLRSCCWVRNIPQSESQAWIRLAKDLFGGKEKSDFRLVLELPSVSERSVGRIAAIEANIERFDIYYFALSILANGKLYKSFQEYAATLCAELANGDVELCYDLCRNIDAVLKEPTSVGEVGDESQRKQLVCRAQTRSISPLIDIGRLKLISIFGERIADILPQKDDYGTELDDVNEVELRHLIYFSGMRMMKITPREKDMLKCLYDARNDIAHLDVLPYDQIQGLFRVLDELA